MSRVPRALEDKVAIVTGGASGIGRASVLCFIEQGARVVIADVDRARGEETLALGLQRSAADRVCFQACDVSSEADVQALVQRAVSEFGRLDIMFNNAGIVGAVGPLVDIATEAWDRTFAVLVRSVFLGTKHAAREMQKSGGGAIINTSSIAGMHAGAGPAAYSACKSAVISLTRSSAVELAPHQIRVNALCPGLILTPLLDRAHSSDMPDILSHAQPWPEAGTPEHIAQAALFLATDQSRFMTGETLVLDGGITARGPGVFADGNPTGRAIANSVSRALRGSGDAAPIGFDPGSPGSARR